MYRTKLLQNDTPAEAASGSNWVLRTIRSICSFRVCRNQAAQLALQEQKERMETQHQMEELKAQALKAQMTPHFLFNALSAIQYFITENDKKSALSYLSLFSKLLRYRLEHFREETALLSSEMEVLEWYLKLQKLRYADNFQYQITVRQKNLAGEVHIPSLVFPFISESAVELSMLEQPAGHLHLTLDVSDNEVSLKFCHNSDGISGSRTTGRSAYREEMEPWQKQVEKLNALKHYHIREKTTILKDHTGQVTGIEILLVIPILKVS